MAANLQGKRAIAGGLGKRLTNQIWIGGSRGPSSSVPAARRALNVSVYDKNPDDQVLPTVVPDNVIQLKSDKYWGPHPKTGVFGPAGEGGGAAAAVDAASSAGNGGGTALDQTVWFRPLEDVDKPTVA